VALINPTLNYTKRLILCLIFFMGLFLALSASALIMFAAGVGILILLCILGVYPDKKTFFSILGIVCIFSIITINLVPSPSREIRWEQVRHKKDMLLTKEVVGKFEFMDAAVLNFFKYNPRFLMFGVGAGQATLASTPYLIGHYKQSRDPLIARFKILPRVGFIYLLANSGIAGLVLWFAQYLYGISRAKRLKEEKYLLAMLITFPFLYLLQVYYLMPIVQGLTLSLFVNKTKVGNPW